MGGIDKGLVSLRDKPMVQWVFEALTPQVGEVMINANRNLERYGALDARVFADDREGYLGPLSGLSSAMGVLGRDDAAHWIMMVPCDSPFVPLDLVERLAAQAMSGEHDIVSCHDGERLQPVFSLVHRKLKSSLDKFLDDGERKIDRWFGLHNHGECDFSHATRTFININTDDERLQIEADLVDVDDSDA